MNEETFASELRTVFLGEAREMLDDAEAAFVTLEKNPEDLSKIDAIFRLIHTIKGSAQVAGFANLGAFAHKFESLIDAIRSRSIPLTPSIVDVLLAGNDTLKKYVSALGKDANASVDVTTVLASIEGAVAVQKVKASATKAPSSSPVASPKAVVLVCDDEPQIVDLICSFLKEDDVETIGVESAEKALEVLQKRAVDIILTDLKMPGLDGLQFIRQVRDSSPYIPVIFISGHTSREHALEFLRVGVSQFIEKPFTCEEIQTSTRRAIVQKSRHEATLSLARESFRAYVAMQRLEALTSIGAVAEQVTVEKVRLHSSMTKIQSLTAQIIDCERYLG